MPDPSLQHISLTCDDPVAVKQFYKKHPGFRRARVVDLGHCPRRSAKSAQAGEDNGYRWSGERLIHFSGQHCGFFVKASSPGLGGAEGI